MISKQKLALLLLLTVTFSTAYGARAEVPVVDLSHVATQEGLISNQGLEVDQGEPAPKTMVGMTYQNEPVEQRLLRIERQISNMAEMNFTSKLEKMQQEIQQLHGQIEVQNHDMLQLKEQVRNFYQDLDQRLTKKKPEDTSVSMKVTSNSDGAISEETNTSPPATNQHSTKTNELQTYEAAFNLLNKKDYDKAINGFQSFVKDYPSSSYTPNAHYWLGEIFYLKGKPEQANKEFQGIITNYPENAKVADAMLKVALIAVDAGNYTKAKQNLTKVQKQFPGTTAAKIATLRLKEIKQKK